MAREGADSALHSSPHPDRNEQPSDDTIHGEIEEIDPNVEELHLDVESDGPSPLRAYLIRALALLCACSLSVGSH